MYLCVILYIKMLSLISSEMHQLSLDRVPTEALFSGRAGGRSLCNWAVLDGGNAGAG